MWFRNKQGVEYKVNDEFIGVKMTRGEAEQRLYPHQWGTEKRKEFLDGLEALGLLKFEEEDKNIYIKSSSPHHDGVLVKLSQAIKALEKAGYRVDKLT